MNLIIDIGNTRSKLALFCKETLHELLVCKHTATNKKIKELISTNNIEGVIISSVGNPDIINKTTLSTCKKRVFLNNETSIPFTNHYKTPKTLGVDRIALVSAAADQFPKKNVLVIDAGTCITYDFLNTKNEYKGGAISPGIRIRFKSLNDYTANLPLLEIDKFSLTGKTTEASIKSGVLNGITQEIDGIIRQYQHKYSNLTVVLTGGDTNFLAKNLKSSIFANPNFLLEGLNSILIHNLDE